MIFLGHRNNFHWICFFLLKNIESGYTLTVIFEMWQRYTPGILNDIFSNTEQGIYQQLTVWCPMQYHS